MKRRIIKQGHNTLTITLPSKWTKRLNLTPGGEVELTEKENGLFISSDKNSVVKKTEIDVSGLDIPSIWKYLMGVYREGYDEVLVKFDPNESLGSPYKFFSEHKLDLKYGREPEKKSTLEFFHEVMNRFVGFEIFEHGKDYVIIREISSPTAKEFDNSLRRVFLLAEQMSEETSEALKTNNPSILKHIHDVDTNLDKFHDYCIRILNKIGTLETKKSNLYFATLFFLELIGDEYKNISHHLLFDFKNQNFKEIIGVSESIREQLGLYYKLFYSFKKEGVIQISALDQERYFSVGKVYAKVKSADVTEIYHHLRLITRYLNVLTELRIQMEF